MTDIPHQPQKSAEQKLRTSVKTIAGEGELISRKRVFSWKALFLFLFIAGFGSALFVAWKLGYLAKIFGEEKPLACVLYGVNDASSADSQFFKLLTDTGTVIPLGGLYKSYDIEAMDIHPQTGVLYAVAGGGGDKDGNVYIVDKTTGGLTLIGNTGTGTQNEIVSASFHPDGTLWVFQEGVGLHTVDLTTGKATPKWEVSGGEIGDNWEGLAWDLAGTSLYGSEGSVLYHWNPVNEKTVKLCGGSGFLFNPTEALDFRPDGTLVGGWDNSKQNSLSISPLISTPVP